MIEKLLKPRSQVLIISGIVTAIVIYKAIFVWPAGIQVPHKQEAFLIALEAGDNSAWDGLVSESYLDHWDFSKANVLVALQDVRSRLLALKITWDPVAETIESPAAKLSGSMHFEATGLYFPADFLTSRINGLDAPWVFEWQKESWLPWSWKLVRIENTDLDLGGYRPGDIGRRFGNKP